MPEDRFDDLDPRRRQGGADDRSAAERLSELDDRGGEGRDDEAAAPSDRRGDPPPARTGSRYGWVVGVAAFLLIVLAAVNTLPNSGRGREGPQPGSVLPDFAAPSALGASGEDANVRQATGGSEQEGVVPACEVRGEDVVNVCELRERPVVLTFVAPGCEDALDRVEAVRTDFRSVSFVGVIIGESHDDVDETLAGHDWGFPVALDPDRAVFNLYRAADCPTTVTAEAGGEVVGTRNGALTEPELRAVVEEVAVEGGST